MLCICKILLQYIKLRNFPPPTLFLYLSSYCVLGPWLNVMIVIWCSRFYIHSLCIVLNALLSRSCLSTMLLRVGFHSLSFNTFSSIFLHKGVLSWSRFSVPLYIVMNSILLVVLEFCVCRSWTMRTNWLCRACNSI